MISSKFDPQHFLQQADHVALSLAADEIFGFLRRAYDLPPSWAALVTRETGEQTLIRPGGVIEAADVDALTFVRVTPIELSFIESVTSVDHFTCQATISISLSVIAERSELESFHKAMLGSRRVAKVSDIQRHLQTTITKTIASLACVEKADALMSGSCSEKIKQKLQDAIKQPCFLAGLQLAGEPGIRWESQSHRQLQKARQHGALAQAQQEINRKLSEARRDAHEAKIEQLTDMLSHIEALATHSPDTALPELLHAFSQKQRGEIYEAVFASPRTQQRTKWIVVAAGEELLYIDPQDTEAKPRQVTIVGDAGAVRSIQTLKNQHGAALLLGSATGVYRFPVESDKSDSVWLVPQVSSVRGGFNAVVSADDRIIASHSELGIWSWSSTDTSDVVQLFSSLTKDAQAVRSIVSMAGILYCAIDNHIICWSSQSKSNQPDEIFSGSDATITAICPSGSGLYAGNAEGDILHWVGGVTDKPEIIHHGMQRPAESLWLTSAHGVDRLVFTDTSLAVHALVVGDSYVCRYEAGGQTLRRVEVADDVIVATTELRDRLICWTPSDPSRPAGTIAVGALRGRSIQDVCLVPETPLVST